MTDDVPEGSVVRPLPAEWAEVVEQLQSAVIDIAAEEMAMRNATDAEGDDITVITVAGDLTVEARVVRTQPGPWEPERVRVTRLQVTRIGNASW